MESHEAVLQHETATPTATAATTPASPVVTPAASPIEISVVLPAYNEAPNIQPTLQEVTRFLRTTGLPCEVVVVDDGSRDETAILVDRFARQARERGRDTTRAGRPWDDGVVPVRLVRHPVNRGYGAALRSGFAVARGVWVFFMDSDGQFDITDLQTFLGERDGRDLIIGYRQHRQDGALRRLNAALWNGLVRQLLGVRVRDVDCAFKLIRADVLRSLAPRSEGAGVNAEMLARAARLQLRVAERPVRHRPRQAGRATGAHPRVIVRALGELARLWWALRQEEAAGRLRLSSSRS